MGRFSRNIALAVPLLLIAGPAIAHPGHEVTGFAAGMLHPMTGMDHLLAMVAVGLWAGLAGNRPVWCWPAAFVVAMLAGGMIGMSGIALPAVESVIIASVIILGIATATGLKLQMGLGAALIAGFGLAHGYAHGIEIPSGMSGFEFAAGFALATALLHGGGLGFALFARRLSVEKLARATGAMIALVGFGMIFA